MAIEAKFASYARETAMCVDLAYSAIEEDIARELDAVSDATRDVHRLVWQSAEFELPLARPAPVGYRSPS